MKKIYSRFLKQFPSFLVNEWMYGWLQSCCYKAYCWMGGAVREYICLGEGEGGGSRQRAGMQHVAFSNQLHLASDHGKCVIYDSKTCIPQLLSEWMASGCYKFYLIDRLTRQRRRWWGGGRVGRGGLCVAERINTYVACCRTDLTR